MRRTLMMTMALLLLMIALPAAGQEDTIRLRTGHFSPGAGKVDIYRDGELTESRGLSFGEVTAWEELPAGRYAIAVVPAGQPLESALVEGEFDTQGGQWITLAIIGEVTRGNMGIQPIIEDYGPIAAGETRVTFFHAVPDLDPIDIQLQDGTELVSVLMYPTLTSGASDKPDGYLTLDLIAGPRDLQVTPYNGDQILLMLDDVMLAPGMNNLIVLAGLRANAVTVMVVTNPQTAHSETAADAVDVGQGTALVRVGHFVLGAGEADMYIDGQPDAFAGLAYGEVSEWVELPAGYYDLAFVPAGDALDDAVITASGVPLTTGDRVIWAVTGSLEAGTGAIRPVVENFAPISPGETRLAFLHAMPDLEPVSIQLADGTLLLTALGNPGWAGVQSAYGSVDLVAGPRHLQITSMLSPAVVLADLPAVELAAGKNNLLVATGPDSRPIVIHLVTDQP